MPTSKKRLNITLPNHIAVYLEQIALRDNIPQATKAVQLLDVALEIEEDEYLSTIADKRATDSNKDFISHDEFWSEVL